mmetsp:Transcript_111588/g.221821  ORF Transcript_111588/g.221821 Transcript_111588/m.221821 type:complete len:600 (-) Transcript_111588:80-1879(-)
MAEASFRLWGAALPPPPPGDQADSSRCLATPRRCTRSSGPQGPATPVRAATPPSRGAGSSELADGWSHAGSCSATCVRMQDLRATEAAQARLTRVIEEVSQELTQRITSHERLLGELQRRFAEDAVRHDAVGAELARLRSAGGEADSRLARHEAELANLRHLPADTSLHQQQMRHVAAQLDRQEAKLLAWREQLQEDAVQREARYADLPQRLHMQLREQLVSHIEAQLTRQEAAVATSQNQLRDEAVRLGTELRELHALQQKMQVQLEARFERQEATINAGQQQLRGDLRKRDAEVQEVQEAVQRFTSIANDRLQGGGQDVAAKLVQLEWDISDLQRREADRRRQRIAQLECDVGRSGARSLERHAPAEPALPCQAEPHASHPANGREASAPPAPSTASTSNGTNGHVAVRTLVAEPSRPPAPSSLPGPRPAVPHRIPKPMAPLPASSPAPTLGSNGTSRPASVTPRPEAPPAKPMEPVAEPTVLPTQQALLALMAPASADYPEKRPPATPEGPPLREAWSPNFGGSNHDYSFGTAHQRPPSFSGRSDASSSAGTGPSGSAELESLQQPATTSSGGGSSSSRFGSLPPPLKVAAADTER